MKIEYGNLVPLGYGKYIKSDGVVGLEPIEDGRGPGRRTLVYVAGLADPLIASRSEGAILRDLVGTPAEITRAREQRQLLADILDKVSGIEPMLRMIIRDQGKWNLDRLEEQILELLGDSE